MKKRNMVIDCVVLLVLFGLMILAASHFQPANEWEKEIRFEPELPTIDDLFEAMAWVESSNDPNAVGECGGVGLYQIREIYVDDVNRIYFTDFQYSDRLNPEKSREMVELYTAHYVPFYENAWDWYEKRARTHNGGPLGAKKQSTLPYWEKVKGRMLND